MWNSFKQTDLTFNRGNNVSETTYMTQYLGFIQPLIRSEFQRLTTSNNSMVPHGRKAPRSHHSAQSFISIIASLGTKEEQVIIR